MVYVNCAARHGGVKTAAPRMTPRQIDDARTAAAEALAEARHPETGVAALPADHRHRRGLSASTRPAKGIPT